MATCPSCGDTLPTTARFCSACGAAQVLRPDTERRKPLTVMFCDLIESTRLAERLDVETYGDILLQYFELAQNAIVAHGGQVEKYIGDAVFAVFGLARIRRDDASEAVNAALRIQRELLDLNRDLDARFGCRIEVRISLNTGEVVVKGLTLDQPLLAGDVGNVVARLQTEAGGGQVVLAESTRQALTTALQTEPLGEVFLKGRQDPINAHLVCSPLDLTADDLNSGASPVDDFVGRRAELHTLAQAFELCREHHRWEVVVIRGEAGIGKSRLVERFTNEAASDAATFRGRCRADGEGVGLLPVIEIVEALLAGRPTTAGDLRHALAGLLGRTDIDTDGMTRSLGSLLGIIDAKTSIPEMAWAMRNLIEAVASNQPVVVVLDDLHLAKPPVVAMLEHMVSKAGPLPVLLVCLSRTGSSAGRPAAEAPELLFADDETLAADLIPLELAPLADEETERLVDDGSSSRLRSEVVAKVIEGAGGVPLFVDQLLPILGDGEIAIPATVEAVVHARLDALPAEAATCLERIAVAGRSFGRASAHALLQEAFAADEVERILRHLVDQELLVERATTGSEAQAGGGRSIEPTMAFLHDRVRSVAYGRITKRDRAELHRRYGDWLDTPGNDVPGSNDEVVGFHFEQAHRYQAELSSVGPAERSLAERAAAKFHAAALRAIGRSDLQGATALLRRCRDLSTEQARLDVDPLLGWVLGESGELREGLELLDRHVAEATERGESLAAARGLLESMIIRMQTDPTDVSARFTALEPELVSILERSSESAGFARFWHLKGLVHWHRVHCEHATSSWRRAAAHAGHVGDERRLSEALSWQASASFYGPMPSDEGIALCQGIAERLGDDRLASSQVKLSMACLYAMRGESEIARFLVNESDDTLDLIDQHLHAAAPHREAFVAVMAGDLMDARSRLAWGVDQLRSIGDRALLSTNAAILAHVLIAEGDLAEAEALTVLSEQAGDIDDVATHISWRAARAKCLAATGEYAAAIDLATMALDMAGDTDCLVATGDAHTDLATVLRQANKESAARQHLTEACDVYGAKGHLIGVHYCRRQLER